MQLLGLWWEEVRKGTSFCCKSGLPTDTSYLPAQRAACSVGFGRLEAPHAVVRPCVRPNLDEEHVLCNRVSGRRVSGAMPSLEDTEQNSL